MAENEIDLEEDINKTQERITTLSSKVKKTSQERDEQAEARKEAEAKTLVAEQERDFFKGFSAVSTKHPAAPEYQEKIWEKVKAGYSVEDATVSVLNAEGKLVPQAPPPPPPPPPAAGGSATITLPDGAVKSVKDLSRNEKRDALIEAEKRGDISI